MTSQHLEQIEAALLCVSEARERAERAAQSLRGEDGHAELVLALENADRQLLALHGEVMRAAFFPGSTAGEKQLELTATA
jgi:hypothetical protein